MKITERIKDIVNTGIFNDEEVEHEKENLFKSWEYWMIAHYTNEEYAYKPDDEMEGLEDLKLETEKGIIYCYS